MNKRRLLIMGLMDSRKKFTARELAERFEVSVRTIQRDLDYLQQMGVPLYTEVGASGGYRVLPNRILPPLQLTQHEALGLFLMLEYLENVPDFPYGTIRSHLAEQYFTGLPNDVQDLIDRTREHVAFFGHHSVQFESSTSKIIDAAVEKREIAFMYESRSGTKPVQAFPLGIYFEHAYWYMPAQKQNRVLLYRVDRMQKVELLKTTEDTTPTLREWLNAEEEREGEEVVLQFTDFGSRLAESDAIFKSVRNNEWRGRVPSEEFAFTARRLLAYGPDVKVIAPRRLQDIIAEMLQKSLKRYSP